MTVALTLMFQVTITFTTNHKVSSHLDINIGSVS